MGTLGLSRINLRYKLGNGKEKLYVPKINQNIKENGLKNVYFKRNFWHVIADNGNHTSFIDAFNYKENKRIFKHESTFLSIFRLVPCGFLTIILSKTFVSFDFLKFCFINHTIVPLIRLVYVNVINFRFSAEFYKTHDISGNQKKNTHKKTLIPNSLTSINSLKTWPLYCLYVIRNLTCLSLIRIIIDIFFVCLFLMYKYNITSFIVFDTYTI